MTRELCLIRGRRFQREALLQSRGAATSPTVSTDSESVLTKTRPEPTGRTNDTDLPSDPTRQDPH